MTISPLPGQLKRSEVMRRAYDPPEEVPPPKHSTALIWIGVVLVLACIVGALLLIL